MACMNTLNDLFLNCIIQTDNTSDRKEHQQQNFYNYLRYIYMQLYMHMSVTTTLKLFPLRKIWDGIAICLRSLEQYLSKAILSSVLQIFVSWGL